MLADHMSEDFWKLGPNLTVTQREYGPSMYFFFSVLKKGQWFEDFLFIGITHAGTNEADGKLERFKFHC